MEKIVDILYFSADIHNPNERNRNLSQLIP